MGNPFFSIIIPTHNGADRIGKALESCTAQSFRDFEIIVVCDCCTDDTSRIAKNYGARVVFVRERRDGLARNAGLDIAQGEWILFLDDDDWWLHEFVFQQLFDSIQADSTADVVNFGIIWRHVGYRAAPPGKGLRMAAGHCWRRGFIGDMRFDNAQYSSDTHFLDSLIAKHPVGLWVAMPMYYYNYLRPGSLSDQHKKGEI